MSKESQVKVSRDSGQLTGEEGLIDALQEEIAEQSQDALEFLELIG